MEKIWNWNEQFQKKTHEKNFTASDTKIIERNRKEVGYLILKKTLNEFLIENLLIEEEFQNLGIGKAVMERIIKEAEFAKKTIRLKVLKINSRAKRFYKRIGFTEICETEFHFEMEKNPAN